MILKLNCLNDENDRGVYKFYVSENLLNKIKFKLSLENLDNRFIESFVIKDQIFYCVYVGKCGANSCFYKRIYNQHINGIIKHSTLRRTLSGILNLNKKDLTNLFKSQECFFITLRIDNSNNIKKIEHKLINSSIHILNNVGNDFYNSKNNIFGRNYNFAKSKLILMELRKKAHD